VIIEFAEGRYSPKQGIYVLDAKIQIDTYQFDIQLGVDTGFESSIFLPEKISKKLEKIGINGYSSSFELADGSIIEAKTYLGFVNQISEFKFNSIIPAPIFCAGEGGALIGLELLNKWISEFNGPNSSLKMSCYRDD